MADLNIRIKGDSKGAETALGRVNTKLKSVGAGIKAFASSTAGIALAGIASGFGLVAGAAVAAKRAIDPLAREMDDIAKVSKRIGITTDEFQNIAFAARRTGASTETVERAFKRMQKTVTDAGKGLKTAKDSLSSIALEFQDLKGLSPEKQFTIIAERLALIEDATTRAAIAQEIFGRAGTNIAPLINEYKTLKRELSDIGGVIDETAIKNAEAYNDALENINSSLKAIAANSGILGVLAESFSGQERALARAKKDPLNIGADVAGGILSKGLIRGIFDALSKASNDELAGRTGNQIAEVLLGQLKDGISVLAKGKTTKQEVNEAVEGFLGGDVANGVIKAPTSRFDSLRAIGGGISPLAASASSDELNELQKQTAELEALREELIASRRTLGTYTGPVFKEGS